MLPSLDLAQWAIVAVYAVLLIAAGLSDFRVRKIPNWSVIALIALYLPWVFLGPGVSWTSGLMAFGIALVGTVLLYLMKVIGAGDSKLFAATALFAGLKLLGVLALATALIGGVIALVVLLSNPRKMMRGLTSRGKDQQGRGIPYGVPIALAALLVMFAPFGLAHGPLAGKLPAKGPLLAPAAR